MSILFAALVYFLRNYPGLHQTRMHLVVCCVMQPAAYRSYLPVPQVNALSSSSARIDLYKLMSQQWSRFFQQGQTYAIQYAACIWKPVLSKVTIQYAVSISGQVFSFGQRLGEHMYRSYLPVRLWPCNFLFSPSTDVLLCQGVQLKEIIHSL